MTKNMRLLAILVSILSAMPYSVLACSPMPGWKPPTPQSAFHNADVVVHLRVLSQEQGSLASIAQVQPIRVLKGKFVGDKVVTSGRSSCGIDSFKVGAEYVFFFNGLGAYVKEQQYYVNHLVQPWSVTTEQILGALESK
ncbi:hypothetical protein HZ993_12650 [Rhodoferax sp. AJA081-3]|uniref:hypothetical protein n=1 Tax=Rhodoferax sp. AJA081-3 TaxID=2752316 RepID=UPI001AE05E37|nr:hypothetical protein [Rhodoferax sp. AJA081-3]QTN26195.1 hypothetical protein HZ993_12650 [Rhodoferax sp. AJA081-3]